MNNEFKALEDIYEKYFGKMEEKLAERKYGVGALSPVSLAEVSLMERSIKKRKIRLSQTLDPTDTLEEVSNMSPIKATNDGMAAIYSSQKTPFGKQASKTALNFNRQGNWLNNSIDTPWNRKINKSKMNDSDMPQLDLQSSSFLEHNLLGKFANHTTKRQYIDTDRYFFKKDEGPFKPGKRKAFIPPIGLHKLQAQSVDRPFFDNVMQNTSSDFGDSLNSYQHIDLTNKSGKSSKRVHMIGV